MTIYLRFENKDALLRAVRHQVISEVVDQQVLNELVSTEADPDRTWQDDALAFALSLRTHLLAHPFGPGMYQREDWALAAAALSDHGLSIVERAGLEGADAVTAFRALFWHTASFAVADDAIRASITYDSGDALGEIAEDRLATYRRYRPYFGDSDTDALFEETTRVLIEGLAHRAQSRS
jgi:AcrR family transcriptional regulator